MVVNSQDVDQALELVHSCQQVGLPVEANDGHVVCHTAAMADGIRTLNSQLPAPSRDMRKLFEDLVYPTPLIRFFLSSPSLA
jgi:hypothetical protein